MKINTPLQIAFLASFASAIATLLFSLPILILYPETNWLFFPLETVAVFLVSFLTVYFIVRRVFTQRIKPIYKIIQGAGRPSGSNVSTDIEEVQKEVTDWAEYKSSEIDKLQKMEKYRKEFLGNVSHELKTPIFNIQGYISTLIDGGLEDPTINKIYLERADISINRLISIVKDLESISRLESGELELKYEHFNISQLIREVIEMQDMRAKKRNIRLVIPASVDKNFMVNADRLRIFEVINNLVINSIIYGKDNGRTIIDVFDMDNRLLIEINDDGIGIAEKHLPRLFERFYRVDKSRSREQGGTGLGLAIVKHIIEAHNQTINVKSTVGEGSSFAFTLEKTKT